MPSCYKGSHWYKGALHCHTSVSDGHVPPLEMIRRYRERGYAFASMTDHDVFAGYPEADGEDFLSIPGAELIFNVSDFAETIRGTHVVALAGDARPSGGAAPVEYAHRTDCAGMNRYLGRRREDGDMLILAHPYWSYMDFADVGRVEGCFAVEIFNAVCTLEASSDALSYWDWLLRRGRRVLGVATDDHHDRDVDFARGWVCVRADGLDARSISASLLAGTFYSSTGPRILDFGVVSGRAYVRCEPAAAIRFTAFGPDCWPITGKQAKPGAEYGEYELTGREKYVRAEVVGADGGRAWTNPIFF
jgi:hypothetical protein